MSKHNRTSRRRRIALGLGATGGGLLAAAFMPVGIALADTTSDAVTAAATGVPGTDPGLFPIDTETVPDPFLDANGDVSTPSVLAADQQINIDNPALAAQLDYDINNKIPFSFGTLDGVPAMPADYNPDAGTNNDLGPFTDLFGSNANSASYDFALNHLLNPTQVGALDAIADGGTTVSGTPATEPTTPDPFLDALQATTAAPTNQQIFEANSADLLLNSQNATYAGQLDAAVQAAIANHTLSLTSTGGTATDADAFQDAFSNAAGTADNSTANLGTAFDSTTDLQGVATQLDPIVDTLGNPAAAPDLDPGADWVQHFDPSAFVINPSTGLEVPHDFFGTLAVSYDTFIQTIPGLAAPYDAFVDQVLAGFTSMGL